MKSPDNISRITLTWASEGNRRRGRTRRGEEKEQARLAYLGAAAASASDQDAWRDLQVVLKSPRGPDEDE